MIQMMASIESVPETFERCFEIWKNFASLTLLSENEANEKL